MKLKLLPLIIAILSLAGCSNLEEISVKEVQNIQVKNIDRNKINLGINVLIENPNSLSFNVKDVDLAIDINGKALGKAILTEGFSIEGNSSKVYPVSLAAESTTALQELGPSLLMSVLSQKIEVRIYGDIHGGVFLFNKSISVDHTEQVSTSDLNLNELF